MTTDKTAKIAALNDLARTALGVAARVFQTQGIRALPEEDQSAIREQVERFSGFTPDNDPYGEHDFGAFEHAGEEVLWQIEYYSPDFSSYAEDPADPAKSARGLTIMLASEV